MSADHDQHRPYEELAVRHVMGSLDAGEASTFRSHLLDCMDCRARVGELRSIASDLAGIERDARRERAAQAVDTKQRDEDADEAAAGEQTFGTPRGGRAIFIVGILLIILLSVWNFVLRGQNEGLDNALRAEQSASAVINFGEAWTTTTKAAGVEGVVRVEQGALAVMVRGTDDEAPYQITLFDGDGNALNPERVASRNQQVRYFRNAVPARVQRVDVTLDRSTGQTVVFRAIAGSIPEDQDLETAGTRTADPEATDAGASGPATTGTGASTGED